MAACWVPQADASSVFSAIKNKHWSIAMAQSKSDPLMHTYAKWRYITDYDTPADFHEISEFIKRHPEWPEQRSMRIRAEAALFQSSSEAQRHAGEWLNTYEPLSGYGKLVLARLHPDKAEALVRDAWVNGDFTKADERIIMSEFSRFMSSSLHKERIERLLREDKASIAERMLPYASGDDLALYKARIALIRKDRNVDALVDRVPPSRVHDEGLLADRAVWRDKKGMDMGAIALLVQMSPNSPHGPKTWGIRAKYVREHLENRRYSQAMRLLDSAGKLEGAFQADLLWLRGWIALEHMNKPNDAYEQFYELYHMAQYPVSKSRGAFWAARAAKRNGNADIATSWLKKAADYPTVFYGQLAQQQLNPGKPLQLPDEPSPSDKEVARYAKHEMVLVAKRLLEMEEPNLANPLISHLAEIAESPDDVAALVKACGQLGMPYAQIRASKFAIQKNIILVKDGWPVVVTNNGGAVELGLTHAIARQESEMNRNAVSPVGARGLMQLMPATAKKVAKDLGIGYSPDKLFDADYNMRLGNHYLGEMIGNFRGSYIMAIAGYNAGPGRPKQWSERFGRPGGNLDDTLNWIETIPFAETRNYVQRVLENLQVYRAQLQPDAPLALEEDLLR